MIEVDKFWHPKSFEAVLADLWRSCNKELLKQENEALHYTENDKTNRKWMRKKLSNSAVKVRLQLVKSAREKKAGNEKVMTQRRAKQLQGKNRPEKDHQAEETEEIEAAMMCWENSEGSLVKKILTKRLMIKKGELTKRCKDKKMKKHMSILHYIQATD